MLRRDSAPAFLIVGTPRSGTTLVQRLACEIPGVAVPPETHFFSVFLPTLRRRRSFPLQAADLADELQRFTRLDTSRGLQVDVDDVVADIGDVCRDPFELFGALIRHLTAGAEIAGEKTPAHLWSWRVLARAFPKVKFVAVVRDPRAVVLSTLSMPWSRSRCHVQLAQRWARDQRDLAAATRRLRSERLLVLRYEEIVSDPGLAQRLLQEFLEVPNRPGANRAAPAPPDLFLEWEWWKKSALGPVTTERVEAWRTRLTRNEVRNIESICRRQMRRHGYEGAPRAIPAYLRRLLLSPDRQVRRLSLGMSRRKQVLTTLIRPY